MANTINLSFLQLESNQASPEVVYNDNLEMLDILINTSVIDIRSTPPTGANGNSYIVGSSPTGGWVGHESDIAYYYNGWAFISPNIGARAYNQSTGSIIIFDGVNWGSLVTEGNFSTSGFSIIDGSDITKIVGFDLSNMPTSTSIDIVVKSNSNYVLTKQNLSAVTNPSSSDDSGDGYTVGSLWIDTTADHVYICVDASVGSAVWKQLD